MTSRNARRFKQVDVFTRVPFRGNPVAVVLDAQDLRDEAMQRIAGWTNLSETTFVLPPTRPDADYRLRIFTPRAELPFAGHPTLGSAHAVLEAAVAKPRDGCLRQECGAGVLDLTVDAERIWVKAPPANVVALDAARLGELERALGAVLAAPPRVVSVGPVWLIADLGSAAALARLAPALEAVAELSRAWSLTGVTAFGAADEPGVALHVRSFAPAHGVPEDPVCGSGNISVAAYLSDVGLLERYGARYEVRQGMALGRDGRVSMRVQGGDVFLGGSSVTCVEGYLQSG